MSLTKGVLKRPVTTVLVILCLLVFGISSLTSSKVELIPEMNMPMMLISTVYPGASPDDINQLVTQPIESEVGILSGIKTTTSMSNENLSIVMLEYEYGTNMDKAYSDLKKRMDSVTAQLPKDAQTPLIVEMDINNTASVMLSVNNAAQPNLYNYVNNTIVPEFEKLSSVASVDVSGGQEEYIRIQLIPEKLNQYHLNMNAVVTAISNGSFSYPAGATRVGSQKLSVTAGVDYDTIERLKSIPILTGSGDIIYLEDVASVGKTLEDAAGIGRYNGEDTISLGIKKQQSSSDMETSQAVTRVAERLRAADPDLEMIVVNDNSEMIQSSLKSVTNTMAMAVLVSMAIIFLFFGDFKASMIVGSSIPVSILAALIAMNVMGFSLNVITLSSLVLGVGMMVDNSIVVLESCFRSTKGKGFREYASAALEGSGIVLQSIIGSTLTTCVVFLPLAFLEGMVGQMFKPLGFTLVFCMLASLISAMTVVPLCYTIYRPKERDHAPFSALVMWMQNRYRRIMLGILPKKKTVMFLSAALLLLSLAMATQLRSELMPAGDEGTIAITIETRPGLTVPEADKILSQVEAIVTADPNLGSYMLSYGGSGLSMGGGGATLTAYLKDDRTMETAQVLKSWKPQMNALPDCSITMIESSSVSMMLTSNDRFEAILQSTQYEDLKAVSDQIVAAMIARPDVTQVHSTLENAAPLVKIQVDPIKAAAEGLSPIQIAGTVNMMLSGKEATTLDVDGNEMSVMVEYAPDEYRTLDQMASILLATPTGSFAALEDVAEITFQDSPLSITRENKQYMVTVTGDYTEFAPTDRIKAKDTLMKEVINSNLTADVSVAKNTMDQMMAEEFGALFQAIAIAVFLVFVVMAAQFESPKFSVMVMTTIPFALIGSFGLLFFADASISMPSLLGFLMLVGTVVNNGILYVDTVNQYRQNMDMQTALIEAGATRLRPILMTTLTTMVAMIPMCFAYGDSGEMLQGLALVNVGGLLASTILSLLMLPVYYTIMSRKRKSEPVLD
ncbi:MAG: efflux RND transporter permease subunit [Hungatella sp.]